VPRVLRAQRFVVQQGLAAIPRSSSRDHLQQNFEIFDFELSDSEMAEIGKLKRPDGRVVNPPHAPKWDS
jgi:2,5-diketo-D-gluconate reductase B